MSATLDDVLPAGADLAQLGRDNLGAYIACMFPRFLCAPHHAKLIDALERVERGECKRLIVCMPPRCGKSICASEHFPAWFMGRDPTRYIMCATYAQDLANDWGRKVRNQMRDPLYQRIFPGVTMSKDSQAASRFNTPQGGSYFSVGRNAGLTGRGASLLILDDLVKNREEADSDVIRAKVKSIYTDAAYTRLMPGGAIVLIGTRWHSDDIIGWLLKEHKHEGWELVNFPAISGDPPRALWPEMFPLPDLLRIKRTLGTRGWEALYQQRPVSEEGAILRRAWWKPWTDPVPKADFIILSVDTAYTEKEENDASAMTVWYVCGDDDQRQRVLLRYAWAEKLEFPELCEKIADTWTHFGQRNVPVRVLIEAKASGLSVIQELRRRVVDMPVWSVLPKGDKVARAHSVTPAFEEGKVYAMAEVVPVPGGEPGETEVAFRPWAQRTIDQCVSFPRADEKDLVDSTTQALRHIRDMGVAFMPEDDAPPPSLDSKGFPKAGRRSDKARLYQPIGKG